VAKRINAIFYGNPDQYPPIVNGARLLAREGFELQIFCRGDEAHWNVRYPASVKIHRVKSRAKSSWAEYGMFVAKVMRQAGNASIFIGHDMHGFLPAYWLSRRFDRPIIYHCHDFAEQGRHLALGSELVRRFERRYSRKADYVIVPDAGRGNVVAEQLRLSQKPIIVANAPISRPLADGQALRAALAAKGKAFSRILFRQGRIGPGHAIESTLRSIKHWAKPDWAFVVMGTGDDSYLRKLNEQAQDVGVEDQFLILPPVGYDEVHEFTPGANLGHALYDPIHINNIHITTASNKIMEYMEAGVPLLVSDTSSLKSLVNRYQCGLVADETSDESIAAAVNTLLGEPEKARTMGFAARKAFEQEFCYEHQFGPVIANLKELMSRAK